MVMDFQEILLELSYRVPEGIPNLTKPGHILELQRILSERGVRNSVDVAIDAAINYSILDEAGVKKPSSAKFSSGGKWYTSDPKKGGEYVGKVVKGKFVKATKDEKKKEKKSIEQDKKAKEKSTKLGAGELESDVEKKQREETTRKNAEKIGDSLYGKENKGKLLQTSKTTQNALDNGYVEGAEWVAPGNAGSNFNENMSNEGVMILNHYPDADEETIARILFNRVKGTKLASQQKDVSIGSEIGLNIPSDISKEDRELYKNCIITARSAKAKKERSEEGINQTRKQKGFGKKTENHVFGGTKSDLRDCEEVLSNANKVYVYDQGTGEVYEIPKEVIIKWLNSGGGGENAADTVVLTTDEKGNVIYDGWSDKKTLKDIQGNSSLNDDYTKSMTRLREMVESKKIKDTDVPRAMEILSEDQKTIRTIESGFKNIASIQSEYFLKTKNIDKIEEETLKDSKTSKHFKNFKNKVNQVLSDKAGNDAKSTAIRNQLLPPKKGEKPEEYRERFSEWLKKNKSKVEESSYLKLMCQLGKNNPDALSADDRKVIERSSAREKEKYKKSGKPVPSALDTDETLSKLRKKSLDLQTRTFKKLNEIEAVNQNGKKKKLGDILGYHDAKDLLHLDKIDEPESKTDYRQILRRNTQIVMEGIPVQPDTIKECIGASTGKELEDNFELLFEERYQRDKDSGRITGKVVYVYAFDKGGKKKRIAEKVYRPKQGQYAPTANTVQWSTDMQKCFDTKRKK
jgi:hypothetical protein